MEENKIFFDEVMRVHEQFDSLSKRVTKLEEQKRGGNSRDDSLSRVMLWIVVAYIASLLLPPLIGLWRDR